MIGVANAAESSRIALTVHIQYNRVEAGTKNGFQGGELKHAPTITHQHDNRDDREKTRQELLAELARLREHVARLEGSSVVPESGQEQAQASLAQYEAIVKAFDGLMYVCSPTYEVEFMNDPFIQRTGRNAVGEKCFRALHDLEDICPWCVNDRVFKGETVRWEIRSPKDLRWYYVVNTPIHHADGSMSKMSMIQDVSDRKMADETALRNHQMLQTILQASPVGIGYFERGKLVWSNQSMVQILGQDSQNDCIGMSPRDFYACEDEYERVRCVLYDSLERGVLAESDAKLKRKDGSAFHGHVKISVLDPSNVCLGVIIIISDISDRKLAEEALQLACEQLEHRVEERTAELKLMNEKLRHEIAVRTRAEEELKQAEIKYRSLVEHIPAITYVAEMDTFSTTVYVSPQVEEYLGVTPDDYRADPDQWRKLLHPEDLERVMAEVSHSHATGEPFVSEYRMQAKNGRSVWFRDHAVLMRNPSEGPMSLQGIMLDITRQKEAEIELRRSEERFRAVFEGAQDCIFIKNRSLKYTHVNPAMAELLGRPAAQVVGRGDRELFGANAGKKTEQGDLRVLHGESIEEERARQVNCESLTFHDIRVPLRNAEGQVIGICGISRNITDRRRVAAPAPLGTHEYLSESMRYALSRARLAAATDSIVLLLGESGSGKDYVARWIHDRSRRASGPYFSVNCAAIARELAESELFGHEAGAFTGARARKKGLLELAEGGTLLLNEIGEIPLSLQSKLLTFLDTKSFLRVGGEESIHVDARLIAATHRDMEAEVAEGRFLRPLFYRLNVLTIDVPPLRERIEDIPILVKEIMWQLGSDGSFEHVPAMASSALECLTTYHWPGNVRELRNVLERALILWDGGSLNLNVPSFEKTSTERRVTVPLSDELNLKQIVDRVAYAVCAEALRRCSGNRTQAADMLGISRDSLYRYMKRFGICSDNATRSSENVRFSDT